jgi:ribosomal protein S18 acetylase RimI-like enzyme
VVQERVAALGPSGVGTAGSAAALLNRELGDGLYLPEWLLEDAASRDACVLVARLAAPVGAAVARMLGPDDGAYYRCFGAAVDDVLAVTAGSLEALAVDPEHRGNGVGTLLTVAGLDWMRERGCRAVVALSWCPPGGSLSAGLFRRLGMREGPTADRFYYEESVRNGWSCPVCHGPCTCAATLFTLPLTR